MNSPHMAAMSYPPTLASTSTGSPGSGRFRSIALRMTAAFLLTPSAGSPAPAPVTASGSMDSNTAVTAELVVVLPMPISPAARSPYPASASSRALPIPASMANSASSRVIAGPLAMLAVPQQVFLFSTRGVSTAMPTSTGNRSAPALLHMIAAQDLPSTKFSATTAVVSCPVWLTPSATTPLSAQKMTNAFLRISGSAVPCIAEMRTSISSSAPSPYKGFAIRFQRALHADAAFSSGGLIRRIVSCKVIISPLRFFLQYALRCRKHALPLLSDHAAQAKEPLPTGKRLHYRSLWNYLRTAQKPESISACPRQYAFCSFFAYPSCTVTFRPSSAGRSPGSWPDRGSGAFPASRRCQ